MKKDIFLNKTSTLKEALKKLNKSALKVLLVLDDDRKMIGTVSDGDVRRTLLKGESLLSNIEKTYNKKFVFVYQHNFSVDLIKILFIQKKIELIPILNFEHLVVDYITWDQAFNEKKEKSNNDKINIPLVIMAGGKGSRLDSFTKILPQSLIPIGDKTIIEYIINNLSVFFKGKIYITVNFKYEMIEAYFNSLDKKYNIEFIKEEIPLGTAGSLKLLKDKIKDDFILSNCDVLVNADYRDVYKFHKLNNSIITIISSLQHFKVPYGVINYQNKGNVSKISEKPEYSHLINTGVYIMNKKMLNYIPKNVKYDMNELIERIIEENNKVFTYPVNENDYKDIGQWEEYKKTMNLMYL